MPDNLKEQLDKYLNKIDEGTKPNLIGILPITKDTNTFKPVRRISLEHKYQKKRERKTKEEAKIKSSGDIVKDWKIRACIHLLNNSYKQMIYEERN